MVVAKTTFAEMESAPVALSVIEEANVASALRVSEALADSATVTA
jgi:hypothetical protein